MLTEIENKAVVLKGEGNVFFNQGNYSAAINRYNQAIQVDSKFKEVWLNKALCHQKLNQIQAALKALTQAINIDSSYEKAIYHKVDILISMKDYGQAIEIIDCYIAQDGNAEEIILLRKKCVNKETAQEKSSILNLPKQEIRQSKQPSQPKPHTSTMNLPQQFTAAIKSGNVAAVQAVIEAGMDVNALLTTAEYPQYHSYKIGESPNLSNIESIQNFRQAQPKFGESPLYLAASLGKLEVVDCLLRHNADVNKRENYGLTSLMVAISKGYIQVALRLLADPNIMVNLAVQDGSTALSFACENGLKTVVEALIKKGVAIHHADKDGETALIISVTHKRPEIVEILLQAGVIPNQCKPNGVSPLFLAAQLNQLDVLKRLIFFGANLEKARNTDQMNPLLIAACQGSMDSIFYLLACGANYAATGIDHRSILDYAKGNNHHVLYTYLVDYQKNYSLCATENKKGIDLFKKGDYQGALTIFELLSKQYLTLYHQMISIDLATCFYNIAECHRELGKIEDATKWLKKYYSIFLELFGEKNILTIQAKLKYDNFLKKYLSGDVPASAPQITVEISSTPSSPSHTPTKNNYQPEFFSGKVPVEVQARNIPILSAISNKNIGELKRLLQEKSNVNIHAPGGGKTPLHLAVEMNQEVMVDLLIEAKADVNATTKSLKTPLHVAAQNGNTAIIHKLLDAGAKIDMACDVGCTALHEAAAHGCQNAVIALVSRGVNTDLKDSRYKLTACQLAAVYNKQNITAILKPELIKKLIYMPAIEFIKTAFGAKYNQSVIWEIYHTQNNIYAKPNMNFTLEKDAKLYAEKLYSIGLTKAFTKKSDKGWELIVPNLDEILSICKAQKKYSQSPVAS